MFGWNRPRDPPPPPSNLFSVTTLGISHSALPNHQDQRTSFFERGFLLLINHKLPELSELFHWGGGHRHLPGQHTPAGLLHLPLPGLLYWPQWCGSGGHGPLLWIGWGETRQGPTSLENAKPALQLRPFLGHAETNSRWVRKTQDAMEATSRRGTWPSPSGSAWPGFALTDAHLCDFLERHFLEDRRRPNHPPQAGWSPGWVGRISLQKAHPQAWLGASGAQRPLRNPPNVRVSVWSPSLCPLLLFSC